MTDNRSAIERVELLVKYLDATGQGNVTLGGLTGRGLITDDLRTLLTLAKSVQVSEEMVERAAMAIYEREPELYFYERPGSPPGNQFLDWEHASNHAKDKARAKARAVIASLHSTGSEGRSD